MWHSTIFGPYFVVGAIYSGIAVLMVAMYLLRKGMGLEFYLNDKVFNNLGLLFLTFSLIWGYFTFAEHLTVWYGNEPSEMAVFTERISGQFARVFWGMILLPVVSISARSRKPNSSDDQSTNSSPRRERCAMHVEAA